MNIYIYIYIHIYIYIYIGKSKQGRLEPVEAVMSSGLGQSEIG
jgi:hypothetical protein